MNKFQLIVLWVGAAALCVYLYLKNHTVDILSFIIIAVAIAGTFVYILLNKKRDGLHETNFHGMHQEPDNTPIAEFSSSPSVAIPGLTKSNLIIFKKDGVEYKNKSAFYRDITSVYYRTTKTYYHGIPASQDYYFGIKAGKKDISAVFSAPFFIGNKKKNELYVKLVEYSKTYIEPGLTLRLVKEIFSNKTAVIIGGVEFNSLGYTKKKLFGGTEQVLWSEQVFIPQYAEGNVYLYKSKDDKAVGFKTISMRKENAVLLPELVNKCYNRFHGFVES